MDDAPNGSILIFFDGWEKHFRDENADEPLLEVENYIERTLTLEEIDEILFAFHFELDTKSAQS